ncbi:hypothetical protein P152DRAFT_228456 [Eremomyces bilateralis CBS 781.70]|uniref:Uncharacterized protein n=1 Tax=Eremomyces bilateralis CBS 781.70 TaxID=1392243 RepID=A0A6G1FR36_9PEZI|nr:uncharacterized protein P152DRAFT_228456 [Eremomyces bilateralis CBS 781.70]KAF1808254.1 hypothetical protein P152DRAFT_228456 [Eremomyces bilateralis CBS 781.70]
MARTGMRDVQVTGSHHIDPTTSSQLPYLIHRHYICYGPLQLAIYHFLKASILSKYTTLLEKHPDRHLWPPLENIPDKSPPLPGSPPQPIPPRLPSFTPILLNPLDSNTARFCEGYKYKQPRQSVGGGVENGRDGVANSVLEV